MLRVYTSDIIGDIFAKAMLKAWSESIFRRKRQIEIRNYEIRICLKKGDTVQKYIDCISGIILSLRHYIKSSGRHKIKRHIRKMRLKKPESAKIYTLSYGSGMEQAQ